MSNIIVLLCLLPSTFAATINTRYVQQRNNTINMSTEVPNDDMWPSDYDAINLHTSEQSIPEISTEESPTKLNTNVINKGLNLQSEPRNLTVGRRLSESINNDNSENTDSRRLLGWLKKLLNIDKTPTVTSTTESVNEVLDHEVRSVDEPVAVQKFLISAILNLTHAISKLTKILQKNELEATTEQISQIPQNNVAQVHRVFKKNYIYAPLAHGRMRRDLSKVEKNVVETSTSNSVASNNVTISNSFNIATNTTLIKLSPLPSNDTSSNTVKLPSRVALAKMQSGQTLSPNVTLSSSNNATSLNNTTPIVTVTNDKPDTINLCTAQSRRFEGINKIEESEVKKRILLYADDTFAEIYKKLEPIKKIKSRYEKIELYKIGYLMANIDTLDANVQNLKKDLDGHKDDWDDKTVLDMFDKLMVSSKIVTTLLESLNHLQTVAVIQKFEDNKNRTTTTTKEHRKYFSWL